MMWVASKATVILSNIPGPKVPYKFQGTECKGIIALIPGLGDLAFGISSISHGDSLFMSI